MVSAGSASELRRCVAAAVEADLDVRENGQPLPEHHAAMRRLSALLDETLRSHAPSDLKRRSILKYHFNGGIMRHMGPLLDLSVAADAIAQALLPSPVPIWKRQRWAKKARPLKECALLFSIGSVGPKAVKMWLGPRVPVPEPLPQGLEPLADAP